MKIVILENTERLNYAAEKLKKYLEMMGSSVTAEITTLKVLFTSRLVADEVLISMGVAIMDYKLNYRYRKVPSSEKIAILSDKISNERGKVNVRKIKRC